MLGDYRLSNKKLSKSLFFIVVQCHFNAEIFQEVENNWAFSYLWMDVNKKICLVKLFFCQDNFTIKD